MSARIIPFPQRGPFAVRVVREGAAWLVTCRSHGWLHGSHHEAVTDAETIARGFGVVVNHPPIQQNSRERMRPRPKVHARPQYPHRNWHRSNPAMTMTSEDEFDLLYGSKYLGAADLKGQRPRFTIGKVETAELREKNGSTKRKRVLYFQGEDKALVVNKTNAEKLAMAFGKSSADWVGGRIELYAEMTSLGKEGVRLQPLRTVAKAAPAQTVTPPKPPAIDPEMDDEVPF